MRRLPLRCESFVLALIGNSTSSIPKTLRSCCWACSNTSLNWRPFVPRTYRLLLFPLAFWFSWRVPLLEMSDRRIGALEYSWARANRTRFLTNRSLCISPKTLLDTRLDGYLLCRLTMRISRLCIFFSISNVYVVVIVFDGILVLLLSSISTRALCWRFSVGTSSGLCSLGPAALGWRHAIRATNIWLLWSINIRNVAQGREEGDWQHDVCVYLVEPWLDRSYQWFYAFVLQHV